MIEIIATQFKDYDNNAIVDFFKIVKEVHFQVKVPKYSVAPKDPNWLVSWEYDTAAFIGQQLAEISSQFSYMVPAANRQGWFVYDIVVKEHEKLAEVIGRVSRCLTSTIETTEVSYFKDQVVKHHNDFADDKGNIICYGFLGVADDFLDDSN